MANSNRPHYMRYELWIALSTPSVIILRSQAAHETIVSFTRRLGYGPKLACMNKVCTPLSNFLSIIYVISFTLPLKQSASFRPRLLVLWIIVRMLGPRKYFLRGLRCAGVLMFAFDKLRVVPLLARHSKGAKRRRIFATDRSQFYFQSLTLRITSATLSTLLVTSLFFLSLCSLCLCG